MITMSLCKYSEEYEKAQNFPCVVIERRSRCEVK